jgi:lipopolysaccharide biosynthesis glycosyltransferase
MKKVFVALADRNFISHAKSLFYSAKVDGEWDGDFVLIVPEEDRDTIYSHQWIDRGVEIFYAKTLSGNPSAHYYKYYLWTEYFKKWDWIFYCDMDVLFFNTIDLDLDNRQKNILYANDCNGTKLSEQFERNEMTDKWSELSSFQSCFMLFHRDLIDDNRFDNLMRLHNEYYVYYDLVKHGLTEEQSILNVEFIDRWKELGDNFMNVYQRANDLEWEFDKMNESYEDDRDYKSEGVIALHFYQFFQPWSKHNLRFYSIWKEYNDRF